LNGRFKRFGTCLVTPSGGNGGRGPAFAISKVQSDMFNRFLLERFGLSKFTIKQITVAGRLGDFIGSRVSSLKCSGGFYEYFNLLKSDKNEFQMLADFITCKETRFFRAPDQFRLFLNVLTKIKETDPFGKRLCIWSAGSSTGEEAYSIAMLLNSDADLKHWDVKIFATDVADRAVEFAKIGAYDDNSRKRIDDKEFLGVFDGSTIKTERGYEIRKEVRSLVDFSVHNLMDDIFVAPNIIFCRNVLIYFEPEKVRDVLKKFYSVLPHGGFLFTGHPEGSSKIFEGDPSLKGFEYVSGSGSFLWRKPF